MAIPMLWKCTKCGRKTMASTKPGTGMGNALKGENTGGQKVTSEVERITLCILTKKSQG